jgi:hypothetical protein
MFAAKANQADGIPIARTFEVGVPGYLLGRTPNGMETRNILGGVLLMIAKSLEMFERKGTKNGSDMAWLQKMDSCHTAPLRPYLAYVLSWNNPIKAEITRARLRIPTPMKY